MTDPGPTKPARDRGQPACPYARPGDAIGHLDDPALARTRTCAPRGQVRRTARSTSRGLQLRCSTPDKTARHCGCSPGRTRFWSMLLKLEKTGVVDAEAPARQPLAPSTGRAGAVCRRVCALQTFSQLLRGAGQQPLGPSQKSATRCEWPLVELLGPESAAVLWAAACGAAVDCWPELSRRQSPHPRRRRGACRSGLRNGDQGVPSPARGDGPRPVRPARKGGRANRRTPPTTECRSGGRV